MVSVYDVLNDGFGANAARTYVRRPEVDEVLHAAVQSARHVAVFGTSGVGKSTLIRNSFDVSQLLQVRCRGGQPLPDLYRSILSEAGARVRTETRLTKKRRLTATLKLLSGDTERGTERTETDVTIDLGNIADVLRLLRVHDQRKIVVLNDFHVLPRGVQRGVLGDLQYVFEETPVRVFMVGVWTAPAYLSDLDETVSSFVTDVGVPGWSNSELELFLKQVESLFNIRFSDEIRDMAIRTAAGSIRDLRDIVRRLLHDLRIPGQQRSPTTIDAADRLYALTAHRIGRLHDRYRGALTRYLRIRLHSLEDVNVHKLILDRLGPYLILRRSNQRDRATDDSDRYTLDELRSALHEFVEERNEPRKLEQRRRLLLTRLLSDAARNDASNVSVSFAGFAAACPADLPADEEDFRLSAKALTKALSSVRPRPVAFDPHSDSVVALEPAFRSFLGGLPTELDEYAHTRISRLDDPKYWNFPKFWEQKIAQRAAYNRWRLKYHAELPG